MNTISTMRKILLHICVVCSLVSITAGILDWYNPYMNFTGHISGLQSLLYLAVLLLAVTRSGEHIAGKRSGRNIRRRRLHNHSGRFIIDSV